MAGEETRTLNVPFEAARAEAAGVGWTRRDNVDKSQEKRPDVRYHSLVMLIYDFSMKFEA